MTDFDIVYFDSVAESVTQEEQYRSHISAALPSAITISVKNQMRMYVESGEPAVSNLADAIRNWPETATSLAAKLSDRGELELICPHGLQDLMDMIVRPTPYHAKMPDAYVRRLNKKRWQVYWPEVRVVK
jgi:hypothetical protein